MNALRSPMASSPDQTVLHMRGIGKRFGSVQALADADFELKQGEIHALLGTNGAGKSTLIKILSGLYQKDGGEIEIAGLPVAIGSPADAIANGVAAVQQHPELVGDLTGLENIFFGAEGRSRGIFRRIRSGDMRQRARDLLRRFPIEIDLDRKVSEMGAVDREIVAVLQALNAETIRILILDEPTSTITEREKASLHELMRTLKAAGISIVFITHRLEEVFEIADAFTIFRDGRNVLSMTTAEARKSETSLVEYLLGKPPSNVFPEAAAQPPGPPVLEVRGLSDAGGAFEGIDLTARRGEILGIYGLVGSGLDELSKALFGARRPGSGEMAMNGRTVRFSGPLDALRAGIFLVPGDRRTEGLVMTETVVFNTTLANLRRAALPGGLTRRQMARRETMALAEKVALHPPTLSRAAGDFSGGNQQKIVISKGLFAKADLYIFAEPTVGVDVGAKATLYRVMRELSESAAVIVMSSDGEEVFGVADRVMALFRGRVRFDSSKAQASREEFLAAGLVGDGPR